MKKQAYKFRDGLHRIKFANKEATIQDMLLACEQAGLEEIAKTKLVVLISHTQKEY